MARAGGDGKGAATLNVGIIGLGGGASDMIPAFVQHPHIQVTAAADIHPGQLERFRGEFHGETYHSAEALCTNPQVDVVDVATQSVPYGPYAASPCSRANMSWSEADHPYPGGC